MGYATPALEYVAKKIARIEGVELTSVDKHGSVLAVLEGGYNRELRSRVLDVGRRAMIPVRVFYRMPDGAAIGEDSVRMEDVDDYYQRVTIAGFAGEPKKAPPDEVAGDGYAHISVAKNKEERDKEGQLRLRRIRSKGRGRPVVGWRYGEADIRPGTGVKFKKPCSLLWTSGRVLNVAAGATGRVTKVSSRRAIAHVTIGGRDGVELPIHAVGHVYDVMTSSDADEAGHIDEAVKKRYPSVQYHRRVNAVGFGRWPSEDDAPSNSPHFRDPRKDTGNAGADEDTMSPGAVPVKDEPLIKVRDKGLISKKTVLLGRK